MPVALTTAAIPPRPAERASAAAHNRRPRSSSTPCALNSRYRSAIARSSTTTKQFYITPAIPSQARSCALSAQIAAGQPAISIDTKKKELVGEFKNAGREWHPSGEPPAVNTYDFPSMADGKAIPYGVYDIATDSGFVSVGIDRDTAQFSVAAITAWCEQFGRERYPDATSLLITADCGGSNGYRTRLWKTELQRLADTTGLAISVCHFPPGTSKWNKIEHRLFSFISKNWRGRPLTSYQVIINSIAATSTRTGLKVHARLDDNEYPKIEVTDEQLAAVNITHDAFHPEWNYTISPSTN